MIIEVFSRACLCVLPPAQWTQEARRASARCDLVFWKGRNGASLPPMPLESFALSRVHCFRSEVQVRVAPLTLVYGQNNAGKSTLLRSLALLAASVGAPKAAAALDLSGEAAGGASYRDIRSHIDALNEDPLLTFDFKESHSKAFAWMLAQRMMEFDNGAAADTLARYGAYALPKIRRMPPGRIATRAGLRVLCPPGKVDSFYKDIRSGAATKQLLEAQAIPREAISKLRENPPNLKEFVNIRQRELNDIEEKRFRAILERLFSKSA